MTTYDDGTGPAAEAPLAELDRLLGGMGREVARRMEERRRRRRVLVGGAGAIAAGAAALVVALGPSGIGTDAPVEPSEPLGFDVESPRPFAVFETRNPDVIVVWQLEGE